MPHRIADTIFRWNPGEESRSEAWNRLKAHLTRELDRIARYDQLQRRVGRRQASPYHARNLEMYDAVQQGRATPPELARQYGLPVGQVRAILRSAPGWLEEERAVTQGVVRRPPPMVTPLEDIPGRLQGYRRTMKVDSDP